MQLLPYKFRRVLTLVSLVIALPVYIILIVNVLDGAGERLHWFLEMLLYLFLGLVWILPLRHIVRGVGKTDPDAGNRKTQQ